MSACVNDLWKAWRRSPHGRPRKRENPLVQAAMRQGQRTGNIWLFQKRADPQMCSSIPQENRAAVVDTGDDGIGRPDQDCATLNDLLAIRPVVPEARQGQCLPIGALETPGLLFAGFQRLPFVETCCGDDAATMCPGLPKGGLLGYCFDPCVEGLQLDWDVTDLCHDEH